MLYPTVNFQSGNKKIMLNSQTEARIEKLQQRLHDEGVVDIKFFKQYPEYTLLTANQRATELCDVIEAMLDGRYKPAEPLYDSVRGVEHPSLRGLLGEASASPITLSPITRCGGESDTGDHNEEQQKGGTSAS